MLRHLLYYCICLVLTARIFLYLLCRPNYCNSSVCSSWSNYFSQKSFPSKVKYATGEKGVCVKVKWVKVSKQPTLYSWSSSGCACSWSAAPGCSIHAGAGGDGIYLCKGPQLLVHRALIAWAAWQHVGTQYYKPEQIWIIFIGILWFWLQNSSLGDQGIFIWYLLYELVFFPFDSISVLRVIYMWN